MKKGSFSKGLSVGLSVLLLLFFLSDCYASDKYAQAKAHQDCKEEDMGKSLFWIGTGTTICKAAVKGTILTLDKAVLPKLKTIIAIDNSLTDSAHAAKVVKRTADNLAILTEPVPSISGKMANVDKAIEVLTNDVIVPTHKVYGLVVKEFRVRQIYKLSSNIVKRLKAIDPYIVGIGYAISAIDSGYYFICERSKLSDSSQHVSKSMDHCKKENKHVIDTLTPTLSGIESTIHTASGSLDHFYKSLEKSTSSIILVTKPLDALNKPIHNIYHSIHDVNKALKHFEAELHKHIHIKVAGITVASFTVHEILKDWKNIVHKVEKLTHISDVKKWLREETHKVMKPALKEIDKSIKGLKKSVHIDGFSLDDMEHEMAALDKQLNSFSAQVESDLKRVEKAVKESEKKIKKAVKVCK